MANNSYHVLYNLPGKLPKLVKPKPYTIDSYGGYLFNDIKYKAPLFLPKKGYVSLNI